MPALTFLGRKWLIACDDFVMPFALEAFIRLMWLSIAIAITFAKIENCYEYSILYYFLYGILCCLFFTASISLTISLISSRGSVMEVEKRKAIPKLLYVKLLSIIMDIGFVALGILFYNQISSTCFIKEVFVKVTVVAACIYIFIFICAIAICYDSLGSSKYWDNVSDTNSLNFFKRVAYIWKIRLRFFCCCADISEDNDFIYVEISTFLASFLNGIDLVPSDILAGIITLSHKHFLERRQHILKTKYLSHSSKVLEQNPIPGWMTPENALYFLRIAKSTYGWMAFFNALRPWYLCNLFPYISVPCCTNDNSMKVDNCCHSNFAAVRKIARFSSSDIIFASFENNIHEPAFYVAINHDKKCIIVAIRGTRSFSDLVTDIDAEVLPFPNEGEPMYKCHRGVLRSAMFLQKRIEELKLLEIAFSENPSYSLVITGHSLGGSVAAVLGLLFKPKFSNIQCYAFGPMAALSPLGVQESLEFVFSVVVGDDMSPRICGNAGKILRKEIMDSLKDNKMPKYKLLLHTCWYHVTRYFKLGRQRLVTEVHENQQYEDNEENAFLQTNDIYEESKLFAPGRILYFERDDWSKPVWLTGFNFQKIIVSPGMVADHQPHKIQFMLEKYAQSFSETSNSDGI